MSFAAKESQKSIYLSGLALVLLWVLITCLSRGIAVEWLPASWQAGFAHQISNDLMPTTSFLVLHFLCWMILLFALHRIRGMAQMDRRSVIGIVGITILLRLVSISGEPIHENDFYRYLWDGHVSLAGENPFHYAPGMVGESEVLGSLRDANPEFYARIGHSSIPTVYPPVAQAVFAISSALFGWSVAGLKGVILCFDVGIVLLLIWILRRLGKNPGWVILYAWNPLVIKEFANSAHYDAVPVFFCLLALRFALENSGTVMRSVKIGIALALGTLAKYFAVLLLPILLIALARERQREGWWKSPELGAGVGVFSLVVLSGFVPFFLWDSVGIKGVFAGLVVYNENWQYSPGVFALVERACAYGGWPLYFVFAKYVVAVVLIGVVVATALVPNRNVQHLVEKCFHVVAALFVLSPTAFPWYFCWVLAFAVLKPRFSWLLLGALLPINYLDFHSVENIPFAHAQWMGFYIVPSVIWLAFAMAWFGERRLLKSG